MFRGLTLACLCCAGILAHAALGAGPPCPDTRMVVYHVADLVIPVDKRPVTVSIGQEMKASSPRPKKKVQTIEARLIERITKEIAPGTWGEQGKIEYRAKEMSVAVSHTPAVHQELSDLLAGLRRRQDVNVCLEVRVVSAQQQTFERIGVDFEPKKPLDQDNLRSVLEAAQGDRRACIMQAPKITCLDKQRVNFRIAVEGTEVTLNMIPTVSADRRFVRLNLRLGRDGAKDETIKAVLADGYSVALRGWTVTRETRQEFGTPFLSRIPYVNRLFKNVGYGREVENVMLMVTPRVIVQEEAIE